MRKLIYFFILSFAYCSLNAQMINPNGHLNEPVRLENTNQAKDATSIKIGYCEPEIVNSLGNTTAGTLAVGIFFPSDFLSEYTGSNVTKVLIGTGNYNSNNPKLFLGNSVGATDVYSQDITLGNDIWNEITLDESYLISGDQGLFVSYEASFNASSYPIGLSAGPMLPHGGYLKNGTQWVTLASIGGDYNLSIIVVLEGEGFIQNEIALLSYNAPKFADINNFTISGVLRNNGAATLNSLEIEYTIDEELPETVTVEGIAVENYDTYQFTSEIIPVVGTGVKSVSIMIKNPNGEADDETDNTAASKEITFFDASNNHEIRKVILEHFTTAVCQYCPPAHTLWKSVLSKNNREGNVVWVAHHAGYYTDSYTISESSSYLWFYNDGGRTYAPASMLDRTNLIHRGASTNDGANAPVFGIANSEAYLANLIDYCIDLPPFAAINIEGDYNSKIRELTLTVNTGTIEGMPPISNPTINVFLTESGLISNQSGVGGGSQYTHDHVIRKVLTPTWGDAVTFDENGEFSKEYTFTIPAAWKIENMEIAAFISNYDSTDPNNCMVYNAASINLLECDGIAQNEITLLNYVNTSNFADINEFVLSGVLRNHGGTVLNSFEVEYQIDEEQPITVLIEGIAVRNYDTYQFNIQGIQIGELGVKNISVKIKNPNGEADDETDNSLESRKILFFDASNNNENRKVLLENFTTAECENCPTANNLWKTVLGKNNRKDKVILISHHAGDDTDIYTIDESQSYLWFYNEDEPYAPASMLDRINPVDLGADAPVFIPTNEATITQLVDNSINLPPFMAIDMEADYDDETRELTLVVNTGKIEGMTISDNPTINIFLTESGIEGSQSGATGTYTHDYVIREVLTPTWGDEVTFDENGEFTKEYSFIIPETWIIKNMEVAAFTSNYDSLDPNNCMVYNATSLKLSIFSSINESRINSIFAFISNSTINITGEFTSATIYDISGRVVKQFTSNQNSFVANKGVYIVKIKTVDNEYTQKVVVK